MAARLSQVSRLLGCVTVGGALLTGCAPTSAGSAPPPVVSSAGPVGTVGADVAQTRADLVRALGTKNLVLQDSQAPFRPPEDARFTATPRALYQVILPDAPTEGFIVVYQFPDPVSASEAANEQAQYLASGPARVQSAFGARHILRLVGSTVVLYSWVPQGAEDARQPDIQTALETLGTGVQVPS